MTTAAMQLATGRDLGRTDAQAASPSIWRAVLRVPLLVKLIGANVVLVLAAVIAHAAFPDSLGAQLGIVLALSFATTGVLVWLALRPIAALESTAKRVSQGDFGARVPESPVADRDIAKLSCTMNRLLDRVQADRARIQYLAGRSVRARDIERELMARELRDSLAQTLAAAAMQLGLARRRSTDAAVNEQLDRAVGLVEQLSDEMRSVAETLYPGTLGEFGLVNAIESLVRRINRRSPVQITVDAGMFKLAVPTASAGALYRVADEVLRNIEQHSGARNTRVVLRSNGLLTLEIEDDGRGMDLRSKDPVQSGLGLFSAKAVLALVGGELHISSAPGLGTRVVATVPFRPMELT